MPFTSPSILSANCLRPSSPSYSHNMPLTQNSHKKLPSTDGTEASLINTPLPPSMSKKTATLLGLSHAPTTFGLSLVQDSTRSNLYSLLAQPRLRHPLSLRPRLLASRSPRLITMVSLCVPLSTWQIRTILGRMHTQVTTSLAALRTRNSRVFSGLEKASAGIIPRGWEIRMVEFVWTALVGLGWCGVASPPSILSYGRTSRCSSLLGEDSPTGARLSIYYFNLHEHISLPLVRCTKRKCQSGSSTT